MLGAIVLPNQPQDIPHLTGPRSGQPNNNGSGRGDRAGNGDNWLAHPPQSIESSRGSTCTYAASGNRTPSITTRPGVENLLARPRALVHEPLSLPVKVDGYKLSVRVQHRRAAAFKSQIHSHSGRSHQYQHQKTRVPLQARALTRLPAL